MRNAVVVLTRSRSELMIENLLLRQQLLALQRQTKSPRLVSRDRIFMVLFASRLRNWRDSLLIIQPDTLLRWHRDLFRLIWRRKTRAGISTGRPSLDVNTIGLIQEMARENRTWGAERIRGELLKLGIRVAKSTIQKYMSRARDGNPRSQTWSTFLHNHAADIWACDFLQTYDLYFRTIFVFVIIELESRRIVYSNVTRHPTDAWVAQQLREAIPFDVRPKYLIRDNDRKFGGQFKLIASATGIQVLRTPFGAPKANAFCERFLGSLRRECLDHLLIFSEHHLRQSVSEYVGYYNSMRPHQGIQQNIPAGPPHPPSHIQDEPIRALPILGGLHHHYFPAVA